MTRLSRALADLVMRSRAVETFVDRLRGRTPFERVVPYARWIRTADTLSLADRAAIRRAIPCLASRPVLSLIMPLRSASVTALRAALASVRRQIYPHWELWVVGEGVSEPRMQRLLAEAAAADTRIRPLDTTSEPDDFHGVDGAVALASGTFVALIDEHDRLPAQALFEVAAEIAAYPEADLIYSDEDAMDARGRRSSPYFKPDFNAELLLGQNVIGRLAVYRRSVLLVIGGLGEAGLRDYALALKVVERTPPDRIRHIPAVLYHRGPHDMNDAAERSPTEAARQVVADHLARIGRVDAMVQPVPGSPDWLRVTRSIPEPAPLVSVIVPTRDRVALLRACVEGLLHRTAYAPLEILIVDNGSVEAETHAYFRALADEPRVRILAQGGPFNYAALNNRAAAEARGAILLLLNNDVEVTDPSWLHALVAQALRPEVGAVGAKLLYPDGSVQHAGVILGVGPAPAIAGHLHHAAPPDALGYFGHLVLARDTAAVTAACMALRRDVFLEVGGFDAVHLAVAFNDVDLCLKIRAAGYRILWTPLATLIHHESKSRGSDQSGAAAERFRAEAAVMRERWGAVLDADPFYGPNFARAGGHYALASPSRRVRPWHRPVGGTRAGMSPGQTE